MRHLWFLEDREGQALVEYALLVALVAACLVAILGLARDAARGAYARTSAKVATVAPAGFGGGSGSAGASWGSVGRSGGPKAEGDSAGAGDPPDSAAAGGVIVDR